MVDPKTHVERTARAKKQALEEAVKTVGSAYALSLKLGLTPAAVAQWRKQIPASRVIEVEKITGIPRHTLRPDLYPEAA